MSWEFYSPRPLLCYSLVVKVPISLALMTAYTTSTTISSPWSFRRSRDRRLASHFGPILRNFDPVRETLRETAPFSSRKKPRSGLAPRLSKTRKVR